MNNNVSISENNVGLKFLLRALRHRNYRLFFAGQGISLTGSWMQMIAVSWLTYRLTNSAFLLGLIAFTNQIPVFLLSPFGGVLADRWNRRNILIITQTLALIQALILAILSLSNVIAVWHIVILSIFIGLVNSLDMPVRQAFVVDMVKDKKDLGNAIALNSFLFNGARLIGASLAGIIIAITGEGICFLLNALSFLAVIIALQQMQIGPVEKREELIDIFKDLKEGFNYALGSTSIRYILMFVTLISVMGMSYVVIMPIFAKDILKGGPSTLGYLMGATGLGAIGGAIYLASKKGIQGLGKIISRASVIFGIALIAFSFSRVLWLSLLFMLCAGFGMMAQMVSSNTFLQHITHDDKRGRVMSLYTIAFIGMAPFGSLLAGSLAGKIGAPNTLLIGGLTCIFGSLFFASKISFPKKIE